MKVLCLSLLRIGDLIMHQLIAEEIRKLYPNAELDFVVNDVSTKYAEAMLTNRIYTLPRTVLQQQLGDDGRSPLAAFELLSRLAHEIQAANYDLLIDLSHTRFSACFAKLLNLPQTLVQNRWPAYLNGEISSKNKKIFHYVHALSSSLGIPVPELKKTRLKNGLRRVYFQTKSSDSKKEWNNRSWEALAKELKKYQPSADIQILSSPSEAESLRREFPEFVVRELAWKNLAQEFESTDLLVSVDTSILHFAVLYGVPTIGIFAGSAEPSFTSPYLESAHICSANLPCQPCAHSSPCSQEKRYCAEELKVDGVMAIIKNEDLAEVHKGIGIFAVTMGSNKQFKIEKKGDDTMENLESSFEQIIWQIYLDGSLKEEVLPLGSSAQAFLQEMSATMISEKGRSWLQKRLDFCESEMMFLDSIQERAQAAGKFFSSAAPAFECDASFDRETQAILGQVLAFTEQQSLQGRNCEDYFFQLRSALVCQFVGFGKLRQIRSAIEETRRLLGIEQKFIRSLQNEIKERGHAYVGRTRTEFTHGSATP